MHHTHTGKNLRQDLLKIIGQFHWILLIKTSNY